MAVERENVETLMEWLAEGGAARSAHTGTDALAEKLAVVVFDGEQEWTRNADRVDFYLDRLRDRFADDEGREQQFAQLTSSDSDPVMFVDWLLPVVLEWESRAAQNSTHGAEDDRAATGWPNPNHDGTPDTEFYRLDDDTQEYLYAARADGPGWATYERRRYSEPARHDEYGLDYRYDRRDGVHQWYNEATAAWNDQTWADRHVADQRALAREIPSDSSEPRWNPDWQMFYRTGPDGEYQFADAVTPGEASSGCGEAWLSHEQVLLRTAQESPVDGPEVRSIDVLAVSRAVLDRVLAELNEPDQDGTVPPEVTEQERSELWDTAQEEVHKAAAGWGPAQENRIVDAMVKAYLWRLLQEGEPVNELLAEIKSLVGRLAGSETR